MHQQIYDTLKAAARTGKDVVYYSDIAPMAGLDLSRAIDRKQLGIILGEISTHEHSEKRPLLSAIVVYKPGHDSEDDLGKGFFEMARELGFAAQDREAFHIAEMNKVHTYWKSKK